MREKQYWSQPGPLRWRSLLSIHGLLCGMQDRLTPTVAVLFTGCRERSAEWTTPLWMWPSPWPTNWPRSRVSFMSWTASVAGQRGFQTVDADVIVPSKLLRCSKNSMPRVPSVPASRQSSRSFWFRRKTAGTQPSGRKRDQPPESVLAFRALGATHRRARFSKCRRAFKIARGFPGAAYRPERTSHQLCPLQSQLRLH